MVNSHITHPSFQWRLAFAWSMLQLKNISIMRLTGFWPRGESRCESADSRCALCRCRSADVQIPRSSTQAKTLPEENLYKLSQVNLKYAKQDWIHKICADVQICRSRCRCADVADSTAQQKRLSPLNDVGHLSPHPSMLTSHHFLKINVVNDEDDFADYVDLWDSSADRCQTCLFVNADHIMQQHKLPNEDI